MKKLGIICSFVLSLVLIAACESTSKHIAFKDVGDEKQIEIVEYYTTILTNEINNLSGQLSINDPEKMQALAKEIENTSKKVFEENLKKQYSDIDFGTFENFSKDLAKAPKQVVIKSNEADIGNDEE